MCNAHNHPSGCNCGWGGIWYGYHDNADWLFNRQPSPRKLGRQRGTWENSSSSGFVATNSSCPVCGAKVYYYESPYGGRVFFDDLGPPWPKHPCTSSDQIPSRREGTNWSERGWMHLSSVSIEKLKSDDFTYLITGSRGRKSYKFYFSAPIIVMAEIVRYREVSAGKIKLSILDFNAPENTWYVWSGFAFSEKGKEGKEHFLASSVIHRHFVENADQIKSLKKEDHLYLVECPDCKAKLNPKNLRKHIVKQHKYIPVETLGKITGRLVLN